MKEHIGRRSIAYGFEESLLPRFTRAEIAYIRGTYDYIGVNSYTAALAIAYNTSTDTMGFYADMEVYLYQSTEWTGVGPLKVHFFIQNIALLYLIESLDQSTE